MLTGYKSVERIDFEKEKGDSIVDLVEKVSALLDGDKAEKAFTMTVFVLEKEATEEALEA